MRRAMPPLVGIFLTVFLDLLGFGLVIPDIQVRGNLLGATGFMLGLILASYSIAQFVIAPILGRLSDRIGRRKILLITSFFSFVCFVVYAHAHSLPIMFLSRVLAGASGANIGVAFAYVADVTKPEERAKGLGFVGAAFGLGFILGPPLGGMLIHFSPQTQIMVNGQLQSVAKDPLLLGYAAAVFSFINFLYLVFFLPESLKEPAEREKLNQFQALRRAFATPELTVLLTLFFVANFAFSNLESTFFLLTFKHFNMPQFQGALVLGYVGVIIAIIQGGMMRSLSHKYGEVKLLRTGYLMLAPALILIPFAGPWIPMLIVAFFIAAGNGLANPTLNSLVSRASPKTMQGGIFGVTQSLGALARIAGPVVGNSLFSRAHWLPYMVAGLLTLFPALAAFRVKLIDHEPTLGTEEAAAVS